MPKDQKKQKVAMAGRPRTKPKSPKKGTNKPKKGNYKKKSLPIGGPPKTRKV